MLSKFRSLLCDVLLRAWCPHSPHIPTCFAWRPQAKSAFRALRATFESGTNPRWGHDFSYRPDHLYHAFWPIAFLDASVGARLAALRVPEDDPSR